MGQHAEASADLRRLWRRGEWPRKRGHAGQAPPGSCPLCPLMPSCFLHSVVAGALHVGAGLPAGLLQDLLDLIELRHLREWLQLLDVRPVKHQRARDLHLQAPLAAVHALQLCLLLPEGNAVVDDVRGRDAVLVLSIGVRFLLEKPGDEGHRPGCARKHQGSDAHLVLLVDVRLALEAAVKPGRALAHAAEVEKLHLGGHGLGWLDVRREVVLGGLLVDDPNRHLCSKR
mmetsp:Transcript_67904/g.153576  ORF Transcript_67904/g.153576 Transcript_67904/m.153576 type:complete len:229 (+) Transcript_67904:57-743(+)